ncbi:MAG: hypothetical protein CVV44_10765 [Spirochaetae bacterium HGW-Spirochaetae-1]|nr:MAG: hypothetical protein CVV44_10765 [Spirochaetae bacterium HGW-Spirochaetae-1]
MMISSGVVYYYIVCNIIIYNRKVKLIFKNNPLRGRNSFRKKKRKCNHRGAGTQGKARGDC